MSTWVRHRFLVGSVLLILLVFCVVFLVGSVLLIFLVFCVVVFGGVRVTHLFSFLCCVFGGVRVTHLFSFLCCVFCFCFCIVCHCPVSCVSNFAIVCLWIVRSSLPLQFCLPFNYTLQCCRNRRDKTKGSFYCR